MDYRKFLGKQEVLVLPYFGGRSVCAPSRRLRLQDGPARLGPGWWRFHVQGRGASARDPEDRADAPDLLDLKAVRGHLLGERLVGQDAQVQQLHFMPEEEPPRFSPCKARRWHGGELLFAELEFESEAEEAVRRALEEGRSLSGLKGIPASLRAAFGYALMQAASQALHIPASPLEVRQRVLEIAEGGRQAAEAVLQKLRDERLAAARTPIAPQQERQPASPIAPAPLRPRRAVEEDRIEAALLSAGAEPLSIRRLTGPQREVIYRFMDERFITLVDAGTLRVLDAGVCLAGADQMVTLHSLPSVIREAIRTGQLVITRRGDPDEDGGT